MFLFDHTDGLQLLGVHSWREREFHTALRRRRRLQQQIKKINIRHVQRTLPPVRD